MSQPRVYISILNWNRPDLTLQCLQSLETLDYDNAHIIVVDNGSRDDSVSQLRAAYPDLDLIVSEKNLGFAGGHHLTAARAVDENADLLWLLNNDARVFPDTLSHLVAAYERQAGLALLGSVVVRTDDVDVIAESAGRDLDADGRPNPNQAYNPYGGQPYDPDAENRHVEDINGSSFMVPVPVIRTHGFMARDYFLYGEETDYCYRLHAAGIPSIMVMRSRVTHLLRGSTKGQPRLKLLRWYYKRRNELILLKRFAPADYRHRIVMVLRECTRKRLGYLRRGEPWADSLDRYACLAARDALLNRVGRRLNPDDFLDPTA